MDSQISQRKRRLIFITLFIGTFVVTTSQGMTIAALPALMEEFQVGAGIGQIITTSYMFSLGLMAAFTAFFVNRIDLRRLFAGAMLSFALGCLLMIFAPNYWVLLIARLIQAAAAGMTLPLMQVVALSMYPKEEYGRAMGIVGVIMGVAPAVGPPIAGFIIDLHSWRAIYILLGVCVTVSAIIALIFLEDIIKNQSKRKFDHLSGLLYVGGFVALMVSVSLVENNGVASLLSYLPACFGIAALAYFVKRQFSIKNPFLDLYYFKNKGFAISTILVIGTQVASTFGSIMVPLYAQDIQHFSATVSGLIVFPGAMILGTCNPITGRILDRYGPYPLVLVGTLCMALGTLAFTLPFNNPQPWLLAVLYSVRLLGVACVMVPLTAYACSFLPNESLAQASSIITSLRQTIGSLISSMLITVMSLNSANALGIDAQGFNDSFIAQSLIVLVIGFVGFVVLVRIHSKKRAFLAASGK